MSNDSQALSLPMETVSVEEAELLRTQATDLVRRVRESRGGRQLAVLDEVTSVGLDSQRNAGRQLELVKTRLATRARRAPGRLPGCGGARPLRRTPSRWEATGLENRSTSSLLLCGATRR